ncbi:gamma-glutamyltransferase [Acinetobacter nectaris]|nr:gamma-glutamyltransferase [Acinetobacter nectaris]
MSHPLMSSQIHQNTQEENQMSHSFSSKYCATPATCQNPILTNAAVTTPHYLATQAAIEILQKGGNAIDAAIAASATLAVVYPHMNSIGGDNFWLVYNAKNKTVNAINASGRSGEKATIDFYKVRGCDKIPSRGYLAANTVPGVVSGWDLAHTYAKKHFFNTGLEWKNLFDKPIMYAKKGCAVTPSFAKWLEINTDSTDQTSRYLQRFSSFKNNYLKENGELYRIGDVFKQPDLAQTLSTIAAEGAAAFYTGSIAEKIIADLSKNDGVLTLNDFKNHQANWVDPISTTYRDYTAYNLPPNTQGITSLEVLNILNQFNLENIAEGSADYYHLIVEATKEAFIDRDKYLTDPEFAHIPIDELLSKSHAKAQAECIQMDLAAKNQAALDPKGDTVWLGIVDEDGNSVSLIQSIYHDFGAAIVPEGTGVLLQNRGSFFSLNETHINCLKPQKRTFHTLNAAMLLDNEQRPTLIYGTMGGEGQPQTQAAIVTRVIDYKMTVQEAVAAPRWLYGRTWGMASNNLKLENRINADIIQRLEKRGHPIEVLESYSDLMGHAGAISVNYQLGTINAATDPRSDGLASGY